MRDFRLFKNAVYFPKSGICTISDLHIGLEDKLNKQGISFPFEERKSLVNNLKKVKEKFEPNKFVFNGDTLHTFGEIPDKVPEKLDEIISICNEECLFIKGSHDSMLPYLLEERDLEIKESYEYSGLKFIHGDKDLTELDDELIVIGHEHPSVEIHGDKIDCCLYEKGKSCIFSIIVLPSFSKLTKGVVINDMKLRDFMSPVLRNCNTFADFRLKIELNGEELEFPSLKKFKDKL
ncbi:MAG: Phosphohydrolase Icc/MPP superfamily [Candidatus Methanohalarchaeum thermophilum]|uniref:Phosphohydrolase Icc/MPP superfamily n=1 Tax=Methanohalarchaeum thermophilum TaxID=1903181 RepID=A0A1Q6DUJ2_METT1|nr:MAG: Phosphohydrolase Icc/MPP superfamily [Candidatus Methanohalarchaeum thermophilum]